MPSTSLPPGARAETESLAFCWNRPHPDSVVLNVWKNGVAPAQFVTEAGSLPLTGSATLSLGSRERPREIRVDTWGSILRFAPDTAPAAEKHLRWGVAVFLALVLLLQAVPEAWSTTATEAHLRPLRAAFGDLCFLVAFLLLAGSEFQARLAFDPRLAGTYTYLQEFLRGIVMVSLVLTGARWGLAARGSTWNVLWRAGMGALACLVFARLFWAGWENLRHLPEGFWITRDHQTSSAVRLSPAEGGIALVWLLLPFLHRAAREWKRRERPPASPRPRLRLSPQAWGWILLVGGTVSAGIANRWFLRNSMLLSYFALAALWAWAGGTRWEDTAGLSDSGRRPAIAWLQVATAVVALLGILLFFGLGATLSPALSKGLVVLGLVLIIALWGWLMFGKRQLRRTAGLYLIWGGLVIVGLLLGVVFLKDLGAPTVWMPGIVVGFLVCSVKPERELHGALDLKRVKAQLALMGVLVIVSLAAVKVAQSLVERGSNSAQIERVRTRFRLADDASYLTEGEWVAQVRTLAAGSTPPFWVPNLNSDVALYGVRALVGPAAAVAVSLAFVVAALLLVRCAEQTLLQGDRERDTLSRRRQSLDPDLTISAFEAFRPLLCWSLGIFGYIVAMMLVAQWLVHLITGISLHLPITGVALPWVSAGNGTHLAFTLAVAAFVVGVRCAVPPHPAHAP
ncbi:hypothetical protein [Longimicrobium sp.]|uniref:hypothetical protein n=1 Tax=Longimicrobium sp. TaxID=2029185 RepID=UPI003B3B8322